MGMHNAPVSILLEHSCMVLTRKTNPHRICCAHGLRAKFYTICVPESRGCPCSADRQMPYAGSGKAVPTPRPRIRPKSVQPNGSTNSWWNHMGGHFLGSISVFPPCGPRPRPVARPSMLSSLRPVSSHPDVNLSLDAIALLFCLTMRPRQNPWPTS